MRSESYATQGSQVADLAHHVFRQAGIEPADIDVAEVHDGTSAGELFAYGELGLAPSGESWRLIDDGDVVPGGRVPVNTSGGLIARGRPIGATSAAQVCELVWQLRSEADALKVNGARIGVAH